MLAQGKYILLLIARWNPIAMDNTDFKQVAITVHSPASTALRPIPLELGLDAIASIFAKDAQ